MQYNMYDAKSRLSELVQKALAGEEIIIARDGKPMVRLDPIVSPPASTRGALEGLIDIPPDFDVPMPEEWFDFPKPWEKS